MAFYVHTKTHPQKEKLDHYISLCVQGSKVTLIKNRDRTYAKKCWTIQKHCTSGEKEVDEDVGDNLSITPLTNTLNISKQDDDL